MFSIVSGCMRPGKRTFVMRSRDGALKRLRGKELDRFTEKLKVMRPVCENFVEVVKGSRIKQIDLQDE